MMRIDIRLIVRREEGASLSLFAPCFFGVFETCTLFHSLVLLFLYSSSGNTLIKDAHDQSSVLVNTFKVEGQTNTTYLHNPRWWNSFL